MTVKPKLITAYSPMIRAAGVIPLMSGKAMIQP